MGDGHGQRAISDGCVDLSGQLLVCDRVAHQVVQDTVNRNGGRVGAGKARASLVRMPLPMREVLGIVVHLHRAVGFDVNVRVCKVDFLSVGIDLEHFPKHIALVVLVFLNLLLASFHGGYGGDFNVLDCSQGPTNGWREQNCRYKVQFSQVRGHSTADGEGGKQRVYGFHVVADVCALTHEAKHLAVEELTKYVKGVPAGQVRLLPRFIIGREIDSYE